MDVFDAIRTRRSVGKVKAEKPPDELIVKVLEAGAWAPNHHLTEPWRFFVIAGDGLKRLGNAMADALEEELMEHNEDRKAKIDAERRKPLRAPVIIAVALSPSDRPEVEEIEEVEAAACAMQNMLLASHALGLGAMIRTGKAAYRSKVSEFFGLKGKERLVGFIYLGYPDMPLRSSFRTSYKEKTKWLS